MSEVTPQTALKPPADLAGAALDVLSVAVAYCDVAGELTWLDPTGAAGLFGTALGLDVELPLDFDGLDLLTQGALLRARAQDAPVRCRIGRLFEVRFDKAQNLICVRRLGNSERRRGDADARAVAAAIDEQRMRLFFQPIIDTESGDVQRMECLARLVDLDGQIISPAYFIPVAERAGLIGALDLATLDLALKKVAQSPAMHLAVNVSAATVADERARGLYIDRLSLAPDHVGKITVEITETIAIEDLDVAAIFAKQVRLLGARVALDDFGEGHTSFRSLLKLPLDEVKIDGLYVESINERAQSRAFVRAIDQLSRELGLETVAERVETEAEANALRKIGVGALQGYHFGRPAPQA